MLTWPGGPDAGHRPGGGGVPAPTPPTGALAATSAPGPGGGAGVMVAVVDQGRGFDPSTPSGGGLRGSIVGRLADVGGAATVGSRPGEGTRVDLRRPG